MTSEYQAFKCGAFVSPLTAATTHSLLEDADPALFATVAYYQAILATHLGARFDAEVTAAGLAALAGKISALAIPYDPLPYLLQAQLTPPFLAVYVASERPSEKSRNWYHLGETWKVLWVLPPLNAAQFLKLAPMQRAVTKVLVDRTEQGYDPSYLSGAQVWAGCLEQIKVASARYGTIQGAKTDLFFPCVELELEAFERKMETPGLTGFLGTDATIETTDEDGSNGLTAVETSEDLS